MASDLEFRIAQDRQGTTDGSDCVEEVRAYYKRQIAELRAERRIILDSVTRHCTVEQINAVTADVLASRGQEE